MASKRETLLQYLKNTLLPGITTGNGYNNTVVTIERGVRNIRELTPAQLPAIFIPSHTERRQNITRDKYQGVLQVIFVGYVGSSKMDLGSTDTGLQQDLDGLIEDLASRLEADRLQGGRVHKTEITDITTDDGDLAPNGGFLMAVNFSYAVEGVTQ